jgi:hypothetical protein
MSYFARVPLIVDGKGIVTEVIRADQEFIDTGLVGASSEWIKTSYNCQGGVHYDSNRQADGLPALRANYATIGGTYDAINDVFYDPQPYPSWTISAPTWIWQAPVPYPFDDAHYVWDEATLSWVAA